MTTPRLTYHSTGSAAVAWAGPSAKRVCIRCSLQPRHAAPLCASAVFDVAEDREEDHQQ